MVALSVVSPGLSTSKPPILRPIYLLITLKITVILPILIRTPLEPIRITPTWPIRRTFVPTVHLKFRIPSITNIQTEFRTWTVNNILPRSPVPVLLQVTQTTKIRSTLIITLPVHPTLFLRRWRWWRWWSQRWRSFRWSTRWLRWIKTSREIQVTAPFPRTTTIQGWRTTPTVTPLLFPETIPGIPLTPPETLTVLTKITVFPRTRTTDEEVPSPSWIPNTLTITLISQTIKTPGSTIRFTGIILLRTQNIKDVLITLLSTPGKTTT